MTKKTSPGQLKEKDDAIRRGFEKLTNSKPSNEDIEKLSSRQLKTFYKAGKQKRVGIRAKIIIVILAVMLPAAVYGSYRALNSDKIQNNPQGGTEEIKDASQTSTSVAPDSTSSPTTSSSNANNNSSNAVGGQGNNSNPNSQSASAPAPAPSAKINNWNVYIYQTNINSCGFEGKPACPWPGGLIISIVAKNEQTGEFIPLKDCSMTATPVGFSIPGGTFSANPSVYKDGGVPVCGGGYDFPTGGQYRLNYEIWLADGLNVDMPYRGGFITNFNVQSR